MGPGYPNQYMHQQQHWSEGSGEFCNHCGDTGNMTTQEYSQQYYPAYGYNLSSSPQNINPQNIPRNTRSNRQHQPLQYTWTVSSSYQTTFWTNDEAQQQTRRTLINRPYSSLSECEESTAQMDSSNVKQLKEMVIDDSTPSYSPFGIDIKTSKPSPVTPGSSYEGHSKTIEFVFNPDNESDDEDDDMLDELLDAFNSR